MVEWQIKRCSKLRAILERAFRWLRLVSVKEVAIVAQSRMLAVRPLLAELMEARLMWHFRARCRQSSQRMRRRWVRYLDVIARSEVHQCTSMLHQSAGPGSVYAGAIADCSATSHFRHCPSTMPAFTSLTPATRQLNTLVPIGIALYSLLCSSACR